MSLEPKKLALFRIWQILQEHSDYNHPLTQEEIAAYLERDYGIVVERKAIGRNLAMLRDDAELPVVSTRKGSYIEYREFEEAELRMLIDGVLCSQHIAPRHSADLIDRLCRLSSKYFRSHIKHIHTVQEWNKTENQALFYNIEMVDIAIEEGKQLQYDYNKYGVDKKLHRSSFQRVTPYQLILHNQKYYLMAYSDYWDNMVFHRLDRLSNMRLYDKPGKPLREIPGYEGGIDYKKLCTALPYMYTDEPVRIRMTVAAGIVDQVIDWFGKEITLTKTAEDTVEVSLLASPAAMEHWAMQYLNYVEITAPASLREKLRQNLEAALKKY